MPEHQRAAAIRSTAEQSPGPAARRAYAVDGLSGFLEALASPAAAVDADGIVIAVNRAWTNGAVGSPYSGGDGDAGELLAEIGAVIAGSRADFRGAFQEQGAATPIVVHASAVMMGSQQVALVVHEHGDDHASAANAAQPATRLQALVDACPAAIVEVDRQQRIRTWNGGAARIFGLTAEQMIGQELSFSDGEGDLSRTRWDALLAGQSLTDVDLRTATASDERLDLSVSAAPVRDEVGRVTGAIAVMIDVTDRKAFEAKLAHATMHDSLTGLPNRTLLLDRLWLAMARARRKRTPVALLLCDLDWFQVVNDSLGHVAGDRLLNAVAERLTATVRTGDTVARLGGDEFAVLCEELASPDDALKMAQRLAGAVEAPLMIEDRELVVNMSIGITVTDGEDHTPEALLRDADSALSRAKAKGRHRYELFNADTRTAVVARLDLEGELRRAMSHEQLEVYYQPIIELDSGRVVGTEALVRWNHPDRGLVMPDTFIPLAEETGLIVPIGAWVLARAAEQAAAWHDRLGDEAPYVSVNLSARQLLDPCLIATLERALVESGAPRDLLCLEITESVLMEDVEASAFVLNRLHELVPRLLVDDFGTGYSSLAYLRSFPLDGLKLDRSFVDGVGRGPEDRAIPAAVASLAGALSLDTLAEGVETAEELAAVRAMGYRLGQGYLWSHPVPGAQLTAAYF